MSQARRTSTYRPPSPAELGRPSAPPRRSGVVPRRPSAPPAAVPRAPRVPRVTPVPPRAKVPLASIPLKKPRAPRAGGGVAEVIELRRRTTRGPAEGAEPAVVVQGCIWLLGPSPEEEQDSPVPLVRIS